MTIEQIAKWLCLFAIFVLVCLGLAERGDGQEPPVFYWDSHGQLIVPSLPINPMPRYTVEVEGPTYDSHGLPLYDALGRPLHRDGCECCGGTRR